MTIFEDQMRSAIVKALEAKHNPEKVELIKYEVAAGSNKGDNFSCELKSCLNYCQDQWQQDRRRQADGEAQSRQRNKDSLDQGCEDSRLK